MEYIKLIGILIVIVGFALKLDSILIIIAAAFATALVSGIDLATLVSTFGEGFVNNRSMTIFILVMLVTGTMERNGLKEASSSLIGRIKGASAGIVIAAYGVIRGAFGAFNVGIGGVAGFIRPVLIPMAVGTVEAKGRKTDPRHYEQIKAMSAAIENVSWFFCQVLFVGGSGALLVQGTLANLGYDVKLITLAAVEIPVAIVGVAVGVIYYWLWDKRLNKKYYGGER